MHLDFLTVRNLKEGSALVESVSAILDIMLHHVGHSSNLNPVFILLLHVRVAG